MLDDIKILKLDGPFIMVIFIMENNFMGSSHNSIVSISRFIFEIEVFSKLL